MNLKEVLSSIQFELKATKGQKNNFGGYQYRSAEDVLEALKPLLKKFGCSVIITETLLQEGILQSVATITDAEGDAIAANAIVGIDMNQKGMSLPQKYGSASSYAKKYALGNLFAIDNTADADALNKHGKGAPSKDTLVENSENYLKVVTALKSGNFSLEDVKSKYEVSAAVEAKLKSI